MRSRVDTCQVFKETYTQRKEKSDCNKIADAMLHGTSAQSNKKLLYAQVNQLNAANMFFL